MVDILTETEIKALGHEEKDKYFIKLQNFVVVNLSPELRNEYAEYQRQIPLDEMDRKIKFLKTYLDIAIMNSKLKKKIQWIKNNFPEESNKILGTLDKKLDKDKLMFLNNQVAKLKKDLPQKLSNEKDKILRDLRALIGRPETAEFLKTIKNEELKNQVSLLRRKFNREKQKKTLVKKQMVSKT
jgi:hypothetical protein